MLYAEYLAGPFDAGKKLLGFNGDIFRCPLLFQAVVTHAAVLGPVVLTKIIEQHFAAADIGFRVADQGVQMIDRNTHLMLIAVLHQVFDLVDVTVGKKQQALGQKTVTAGTADFLIIAFNVFGQIIMNHKPDIGFVDSHSKGNGGHHNLDVIPDKQLLIFHTLHVGQTGMVGPDGISFGVQDAAQTHPPACGRSSR